MEYVEHYYGPYPHAIYQERAADRLLREAICKNTTLPYVYSLLREGKTRILREQFLFFGKLTGFFRCAFVSPYIVGPPVWENGTQFFYSMCAAIISALLKIDPYEYERKIRGKCSKLSEKELIKLLVCFTSENFKGERIVVFIDDIQVLCDPGQPSGLLPRFLEATKICKPIQFVLAGHLPFEAGGLLAGIDEVIPLNPLASEEIEEMILSFKDVGISYPTFGQDLKIYTGGSVYLMQVMLSELWFTHAVENNLKQVTPEDLSVAADAAVRCDRGYLDRFDWFICRYEQSKGKKSLFQRLFAKKEPQTITWLMKKPPLEFLQAIGLIDQNGQFYNEICRRYSTRRYGQVVRRIMDF